MRQFNDFNDFERTAMQALDWHLHHNPQKVVDFKLLEELNNQVNAAFPELILIGPDPNEHAGVGRIPGTNIILVFKLETHISPSKHEPYGSSVTCITGSARDTVIMGARPFWALNLIGGPPADTMIAIGPCVDKGDGSVCKCGKCEVVTIGERNKRSMQGMVDACKALDIGMMGGCLTTSIMGPAPAIAAAIVGVLTIDKPLKKPAQNVGDKLILIGLTGKDGNDTAYRAGLAPNMYPAEPKFEEERISMEGVLAGIQTGKVNAGSDLGAAGIVAASRESACASDLGVIVHLSEVPLMEDALGNTPFEVAFNETQARYMLQVGPKDVNEVLATIRAQGAIATVIGEITDSKTAIYTYDGDVVAEIPNPPHSAELMAMLSRM